eukprot:10710609-Karenia_brevis.AAC.1
MAAMSRHSPFCFDGDVRGRAREMLDSITNGSAMGMEMWAPHSGQTFSSCYNQFDQSESLPLVASRLSLPETAVVVKLQRRLSTETAQLWNMQTKSDDEPPQAYFAATEHEWR